MRKIVIGSLLSFILLFVGCGIGTSPGGDHNDPPPVVEQCKMPEDGCFSTGTQFSYCCEGYETKEDAVHCGQPDGAGMPGAAIAYCVKKGDTVVEPLADPDCVADGTMCDAGSTLTKDAACTDASMPNKCVEDVVTADPDCVADGTKCDAGSTLTKDVTCTDPALPNKCVKDVA